MMRLPLSRPNLSEEAIARVGEVLRSGALVQGRQVEAFERELASFVEANEAVVVSSGTAALYLAIKALGLGHGHAVILPGFTFPATINAALVAGCRPVIVDVHKGSYCLDLEATAKAIKNYNGDEILKAVMVVHEFGTPCDIVGFGALAKDHGLLLIEDAACALGSVTSVGPVGSGSDAACFSFHPRKTLTTGEGGFIATDRADLAESIKILRNHGINRSASGSPFVEPALNFRLTDFQAALGRVQLPDIGKWIERRCEIAERYFLELGELVAEGAITLPGRVSGQSWQTFMILLARTYDRDAIIFKLGQQGIETNLGAQALGTIPAYARFAGSPLVVSESLFRHGLALPMFEQMTDADVVRVSTALKSVLAHAA